MKLPAVDALRCFVEAADTLNFATAAKAVHLTPAALGQRIKQLEALVGEPLFDRSRRGVSLTLKGSALVSTAKQALAAVQKCVYAEEDKGLSGDVTIGIRYDLAVAWMAKVVPRVFAAQPRLNVHLSVAPGAELIHRLRLGEIDCAVSPARMTDSKLEALNVQEERVVFVGRADLLRKHPFKTETQASAHRLIDLSPALPMFGYFRDAAPDKANMHFSSISYFGTSAAAYEMVMAGLGVAVLPEHLVSDAIRQKVLRRLFPEVALLSWQLRLVFRLSDPRRALFEWLANELRHVPLVNSSAH